MARPFHRQIHIHADVREYVSALSLEDAALFNELLSRLDANPIEYSRVVLADGKATMRRAEFGAHSLTFTWKPTVPPNGRLDLTDCRPNES
jgi:hypothetical protein